jgi:hypothetical protein
MRKNPKSVDDQEAHSQVPIYAQKYYLKNQFLLILNHLKAIRAADAILTKARRQQSQELAAARQALHPHGHKHRGHASSSAVKSYVEQFKHCIQLLGVSDFFGFFYHFDVNFLVHTTDGVRLLQR